MSLGARIRQLRRHYKYSQTVFGEKCGGVTKGTVSQWESDLAQPPIERLLEFRKSHPFNFEWLLAGAIPNPYDVTPEAKVYLAMQQMSPQEKYQMVKIGNSFVEPEGNGGDQPHPHKTATQ